jgi:hypothetical protein
MARPDEGAGDLGQFDLACPQILKELLQWQSYMMLNP